MLGIYPSRPPKANLFRVAYGSHPLALRPWKTVTAITPMSGRWDDPEGGYRVLYMSTTARGALREALQYFRPSQDLLARLLSLDYDDAPFEYIGMIPTSWLATRTLSEIRVQSGKCVPVCSEAALDAIYRQCGIRFTAGDLLAQNGLAWTRYISRMIWRKRIYSGIETPSKFGTDLRNYAFFEDRPHSSILRAKLETVQTAALSAGNPLLVAVAEALGLRIERVPTLVSFLRAA